MLQNREEMKTKIFFAILLITIISIVIFISCETKPTKPVYDNPFDPQNKVGDNIPPIISLIVTPDSGIAKETLFRFDATGSYENDNPNLKLYYRWDINNDGNYETDWSQNHIYTDSIQIGGGDKQIKLEVLGQNRFISDTVFTVFVNTHPLASFSGIQDTTNNLLIYFDASASFDFEDGTNLRYRWDFDGDGNWETSRLAQNTISYVYASFGVYSPKLLVIDLNNLSSEISIQVTVGCIDIDGNTYQIVKIGNQWWMAENLKVTHYQNGDLIPNITDSLQWTNLTSGAYCNYNNDVNNVATYGRLYNWYAVDDSRSIAPVGWHVPSDDEWKELEMYLGMSQSDADASGWRGTDEGGKMKETGTTHWNSPNTGATNSSGFSALPGGWRYHTGDFDCMGLNDRWWSVSEYSSMYAWFRVLTYSSSQVYRGFYDKQFGYSSRCVRD